MTKFHLHLVSDSTGETAHALARACLAQFEGVDVEEHHWTLIRSVNQLDKVMESIMENPGVVMYTLVNDEFRKTIQSQCQKKRIPCISVLDPIIHFLGTYLGAESKGKPGIQHEMDEEYFARIDAMQYALAHDDGQGYWNLDAADIILLGVSRTSKTPTCLYIANRGLKAANVPYVPGVPLPEELLNIDELSGPMVVGLTKDPDRLIQIRKNRLRSLNEDDNTDYVDIEIVREEVVGCRRVCSEHKWPVIDVTRRSIEETAAAAMKLYETRQLKYMSTEE